MTIQQDNANKLDSPIVLLCSERSGSNLITKMFDAHPDVSAPGACHLFRVMSECGYQYKSHQEMEAAVWKLFDAKLSSWSIDGYSEETRHKITETSDGSAELCASIYNAEAENNGKRHALLKENSVYQYAPYIMQVSTKPRFLFMVRDPRDMALSWTKAEAIRGGIVRSTNRWLDDQIGSLRLLSWFKNNIPISFLRYEDLLSDSEQELRRVCSELQIDYSDTMLHYHEKSQSAIIDSQMRLWGNLSKPILKNNFMKFLNELDDNSIAYIEAKTSPYLERFGYKKVRDGKPLYGTFETFEELEDYLISIEPKNKPTYYNLPAETRQKFENWSQLYTQMTSITPIIPG